MSYYHQAGPSTSAVPPPSTRFIRGDAPLVPADYSAEFEHLFDASTVSRLTHTTRPIKLYDAIAHAHDQGSKGNQNGVDLSWTTPRPLIGGSRRLSVSKAVKDSETSGEYSPYIAAWNQRRSFREARRSVARVTLCEVNTLVPYIPPIDVGVPPPEWLDEQAKRFLAEAQADLERSKITSEDRNDDDVWNFGYENNNIADLTQAETRKASAPQPPSTARPVRKTDSHKSDDGSDSETSTNSDVTSDNEWNWSMNKISESSPLALADVPKWIIPRRRPSADAIPVECAADVEDLSDIASSSDEEESRQQGGARLASSTPTRHPSVYEISDSEEEDSSTTLTPSTGIPSIGNSMATSSHDPTSTEPTPIASPPVSAPGILPSIAINLPKASKVFPCLLDGCHHICGSAGDLQRHQQSLRHRTPSYECLACGKSYTRSDALKRHLNSKATCKKEHAAGMANAAHGASGGGQGNTRIGAEAVYVVE